MNICVCIFAILERFVKMLAFALKGIISILINLFTILTRQYSFISFVMNVFFFNYSV
jgi:hypothetical protein